MTRDKMTLSVPPELVELARQKSLESGIAISEVLQRALAQWVETGEAPPPLPARFASKGRPGPKPKAKRKPKAK